MPRYVIQGHYVEENGTLERGRLWVDRNGTVFLDDVCGLLTARTYAITRDETGVEITSALGAWTFLPDAGECERIGLPIVEKG